MRPSRGGRGSERPLNTVPGVVNFAPNLCRCRARSSRRTLVLQRIGQHRPGFTAQEARHPSADRHRLYRAHLYRSGRPLRRRTRRPSHRGCRDATADYTDEMMHAALDISTPNYASAIVTTKEIVASISSLASLPSQIGAGATASYLSAERARCRLLCRFSDAGVDERVGR